MKERQNLGLQNEGPTKWASENTNFLTTHARQMEFSG